MLKLTWFCDNCKKMITEETMPIEDSYDVYHPDSVNWCLEKDVERELCLECYEVWLKKIEEDNPGAVWTA